MKRIIFTLTIIAGVILPAMAQIPSISSANMFAIGELNVQYSADTVGISPGATGANVTWDFSALKQSSAKDSTVSKFITVASSPYGADFPNADMALASVSGQNYIYATFKNNTVSIIGAEGQQTSGGQTFTIKQIYDKPEIMYAYPLTWNTNQTNPYAAHYDVAGTTVYRRGTVSVKGDAYGTLKIMNKTFTNVLRLHSITNEVDSFPGFPMNQTFTLEAWSYTTPGKKDAILTISQLTQSGQGSKSVSYNINSKTLGIEDQRADENSIQIYPNPAKQNFRMTYNSATEGAASIEITNQLGQNVTLVQNQVIHMGLNTINFDLNNISRGFYIVRITKGNMTKTQRLMVE
jgi:hypothetical protein